MYVCVFMFELALSLLAASRPMLPLVGHIYSSLAIQNKLICYYVDGRRVHHDSWHCIAYITYTCVQSQRWPVGKTVTHQTNWLKANNGLVRLAKNYPNCFWMTYRNLITSHLLSIRRQHFYRFNGDKRTVLLFFTPCNQNRWRELHIRLVRHWVHLCAPAFRLRLIHFAISSIVLCFCVTNVSVHRNSIRVYWVAIFNIKVKSQPLTTQSHKYNAEFFDIFRSKIDLWKAKESAKKKTHTHTTFEPMGKIAIEKSNFDMHTDTDSFHFYNW